MASAARGDRPPRSPVVAAARRGRGSSATRHASRLRTAGALNWGAGYLPDPRPRVGALLADREGVVLHLGFCLGNTGAGSADGHAWLTLNGDPLLDPETGGAAYVESLRLPMRRFSRDTTSGLRRSKRDSKR